MADSEGSSASWVLPSWPGRAQTERLPPWDPGWSPFNMSFELTLRGMATGGESRGSRRESNQDLVWNRDGRAAQLIVKSPVVCRIVIEGGTASCRRVAVVFRITIAISLRFATLLPCILLPCDPARPCFRRGPDRRTRCLHVELSRAGACESSL